VEMGSKHGKYVYIAIDKDLYAKVRVFKKKDPKSADAYAFYGVFVKKPPRKAVVLSSSDLPEEILNKIKSYLSSI
jgi:hypothetical protein